MQLRVANWKYIPDQNLIGATFQLQIWGAWKQHDYQLLQDQWLQQKIQQLSSEIRRQEIVYSYKI